METSSDKVRRLLEIARRSGLTQAVVCTTCFTLMLVVVMARAGKAAAPSGKEQRSTRLHKRNKFFNPAAAAAATAAPITAAGTAAPSVPFPTVDQVLSLKEVPVADPMAIVWDPV